MVHPPIELEDTPPKEYRRAQSYEDVRGQMSLSCTWPSEEPLELAQWRRTDEVYVQLQHKTKCIRPDHATPFSITVDFGAVHELLHVNLVSSAQCVEVFVGHRTSNGHIRFVYAETTLGVPERHYPNRFHVEYACPATSTFHAIAAITFKFAEVSDEHVFALDDLQLVFLPPVVASKPISSPQDPRAYPMSRGYEGQRHSVRYGHGQPRHYHPPATPYRASQHHRHPADHDFDGMVSSRSLPDQSKPQRDAPLGSEGMSAMMMVLDMQKKMLDDLEKRICATVDLKVHQAMQRIDATEELLHELESRVDGIQLDKEIVFAGILHRLDKLEEDVTTIKKEQDETAASVQEALRKSVTSAVRPSRWQY